MCSPVKAFRPERLGCPQLPVFFSRWYFVKPLLRQHQSYMLLLLLRLYFLSLFELFLCSLQCAVEWAVAVGNGKSNQYLIFENGNSVFFLACDGNLWKIMPISSIWKQDFRCFFGLWWEHLENNTNIFYLKTGFPSFFGIVMGTFRKYCQYLLFENGISVVFWACDGNLWKIIPISSIWKRDFRGFLGLWR